MCKIMDKTFLTVLILLIAAALNFDIKAEEYADSISKYPEIRQRHREIEGSRIIKLGGNDGTETPQDSMRSLIVNFYLDQYRHFQDPHAPFFMFMSKDANYAMGVGGVIRMRGWYDWGGSIPANGFAPYLIPIPADPTSQRHLAATPAGCALFMTLIGRNTPVGRIMAYVEGNFNGYQHIDFRLKKAYVSIGDWTMGYASTTFSDPASQTPTIDGAGPNGQVSKSTVLLRYFHTFKNGWGVAGGIEFPSSQIGADGNKTATCTDYIPDFVALGQYQWAEGMSHIRLSAILRSMRYRNLLTETNHSVWAWGLQASGTVKIIPSLSVYGQAVYGRGLGSYTGDLAIGNYDLVGKPSTPGEMFAPRILGLSAGVKYNFKDNVYSCVALGSERYYLDEANPDEYKYGLYGAVNVFWDIMPRLQVGLEYLIGKRMNFSGAHRSANRIDALFMFTF